MIKQLWYCDNCKQFGISMLESGLLITNIFRVEADHDKLNPNCKSINIRLIDIETMLINIELLQKDNKRLIKELNKYG